MNHYWIIENCGHCEGFGFDPENYTNDLDVDKLCPVCNGYDYVAVKIYNNFISSIIYGNEVKFRTKKQALSEIEKGII